MDPYTVFQTQLIQLNNYVTTSINSLYQEVSVISGKIENLESRYQEETNGINAKLIGVQNQIGYFYKSYENQYEQLNNNLIGINFNRLNNSYNLIASNNNNNTTSKFNIKLNELNHESSNIGNGLKSNDKINNNNGNGVNNTDFDPKNQVNIPPDNNNNNNNSNNNNFSIYNTSPTPPIKDTSNIGTIDSLQRQSSQQQPLITLSSNQLPLPSSSTNFPKPKLTEITTLPTISKQVSIETNSISHSIPRNLSISNNFDQNSDQVSNYITSNDTAIQKNDDSIWDNIPFTNLNPSPRSVQDVLDEWYLGYEQQPPLYYMELYRKNWRRGDKNLSKKFCRRYRVVTAVEIGIKLYKKEFPTMTEDSAREKIVQELETLREKEEGKKETMYWLFHNIPQHLKRKI
ncbi:hypothetical protein WICMUC_002073 [Wickerhamomyces mucosus]|uniref:Transcription activator GCR1-like domain-containing protein n=1 Tax=Wickerhamomyces mucosus TaxID=1378264 RepID=A0A9P8PQJ6_9ASCO|nr:hypothetical protein WICMUC_002073 [Wickerhamomyces mucosus]